MATVTSPMALEQATLRAQRIELPSWAFGNSGTRFKVFAQDGVPRDPYEKIADAAEVNRFTGVAPTVALHIPWDKVDDYDNLAAHAHEHGVALGTINTNTFQDDDYMLGSVCHVDERVRGKAVDHLLECVDIMDATGSARPEAVVRRRDRTTRVRTISETGRTVSPTRSRTSMSGSARSSVWCSNTSCSNRPFTRWTCPIGGLHWSTVWHSDRTAQRSCVDTGHHAPGTNIEFIVMLAVAAGQPGRLRLQLALLCR